MSSPSSPLPAPAQPTADRPGVIARFFARVVARRWLIVAFYAAILPPSIFYAVKVGQDNAIERLMVPTDPDYVNTLAFQKVFGTGEYAVLLAEADDPYAPAVLERIDRLEQAVAAVPRVQLNSALSTYRRARAGFAPTKEQSEAFRKFAAGTDIFVKQGLAGEHFLALALILDTTTSDERSATVAALDRAIDGAGGGSPPLRALRRVGQPYVSVHLDDATRRAGPTYFSLFALFVVVLNVALYRSVRTLAAFLITLGVCLATSVGYIGDRQRSGGWR